MEANVCSLENFVKRRAGHVLVSYDSKLYMWGGYMEEEHIGSYNLMTQSNSHFHSPNDIWIYSPFLNIWSRRTCTGDIPFQLSGSCAGVIDNHMYLFGGFNGDHSLEGSNNLLWRLDLITFVWKLLVPSGFQPFSCDKSASWIYGKRFYIFGGYGTFSEGNDHPPVHVSFVTEEGINSKGWLDQLVYYESNANSWIWPKCRGSKPSARAAHAAAVIDHTAYIFGGRHREARLNDFYCLNMETHIFSSIIQNGSNSFPIGRSWHTLNAISEDKLLLYGGFSTTCQVLNDAWIYKAVTMTFESLSSSNYPKRLWHCGVKSGNSEVIILGGICNNLLNYTEPKEHAEDMLKIRLSPPSLFELVIEYLCNSKKVPRSSWSQLTYHVRRILEVRTDPFEIHGI